MVMQHLTSTPLTLTVLTVEHLVQAQFKLFITSTSLSLLQVLHSQHQPQLTHQQLVHLFKLMVKVLNSPL